MDCQHMAGRQKSSDWQHRHAISGHGTKVRTSPQLTRMCLTEHPTCSLTDPNSQLIKEEGVNGKIQIRHDRLMKGSLSDSSASSEALTPVCWVHSGDIGSVQNGRYYAVDCTEGLVGVSSCQVGPAGIERALLEHPDQGAAGMPIADDSDLAEVRQGFVVKKPNSAPALDLDEKAMKPVLAERLSRYE